MDNYTSTVHWQRDGAAFLDRRYSRRHVWRFDGGAVVDASASPHVVPVPYSDPAGIDPEEAFVAAVSSCHMLWFLDLAARAGWVVDTYRDEALGLMDHNDEGQLAITRVTLRPSVQFDPQRAPTCEQVQGLHQRAHQSCFIAHSVKSEVLCQPVFEPDGPAP
jgi:organic hydroperoxide reductase OsmC/OhrA